MTRSDARKRLNPPADYEWPTWGDIHDPARNEAALRSELAETRTLAAEYRAALKVATEALYGAVSRCDCDHGKGTR